MALRRERFCQAMSTRYLTFLVHAHEECMKGKSLLRTIRSVSDTENRFGFAYDYLTYTCTFPPSFIDIACEMFVSAVISCVGVVGPQG